MKCLLIFPVSFYSFSRIIKSELESRNYDVLLLNEEYPNNGMGKLIGKLDIPISRSITKRVICRKIENQNFDVTLIFKGRGVSKELIKFLKLKSKQVIGYNFDSFDYYPQPLKWFKYVDKYYTFDYRDSKNYSIPIIELFSSTGLYEKQNNRDYQVSAIIRNHSNRLSFLDKVKENLKNENFFIYIYEKNIFSLLWSFIKQPYLTSKYFQYIHLTPIPYETYISILKQSKYTLDYAHPKQTGITIRCFEALSNGCKIISNNIYLKRSSFFDSSDFILPEKVGFEKLSELLPLFDKNFRSKYRSVITFMNEILMK